MGPLRVRLLDLALLLTALVLVVSAYIRLSQAGIGCAPWPECYGRLSAPAAPGWATALHRLSASALGAVVLAITLATWRRGERHRPLALLALALTVFLALLGLRSGTLDVPAVVLANLLGGIALAAVLFWYRLRARAFAAAYTRVPVARSWIALGGVLVVAAIVFGAATSAHFGLRACIIAPQCPGGSTAALLEAFADLERPLATDASGIVIGGAQAALHGAHRAGGWLAAAYLSGVAVVLWRRMPAARPWALLLLGLVTTEALLGLGAIGGLPAALAVAHNGIATVLLLTLLLLLQRAGRGAPRRLE